MRKSSGYDGTKIALWGCAPLSRKKKKQNCHQPCGRTPPFDFNPEAECETEVTNTFFGVMSVSCSLN